MPYTRAIFSPVDDSILIQREEEGFPIEYDRYFPIIPMVLVNGCSGIATGFRTIIPCHCPLDIIRAVRERLQGEPLTPLLPSYTGWTGTVSETDTEWQFDGCYVSGTITELPIQMATEKYKTKVLYPLVEHGKINNISEHHPTENSVCFKFQPQASFSVQDLKLTTRIPKTCLNLLVDDKIVHFKSTVDILNYYYDDRIVQYEKRRAYLLDTNQSQLTDLEYQALFIRSVLQGTIQLQLVTKDTVGEMFTALHIPLHYIDTFMAMSLWSLTQVKIDHLMVKMTDIKREIDHLKTTNGTQMWLSDLDVLSDLLQKQSRKTKKRPRD